MMSIDMVTLRDILVARSINLLTGFFLMLVFVFLRLHPINDEYTFPMIPQGLNARPKNSSRSIMGRLVNLDYRMYIQTGQ